MLLLMIVIIYLNYFHLLYNNFIKTNMLYKPDSSKECGFDKKVIIPDIKLRTLFSLNENETLDFSSINKGVATIYNNV